MAKKGVDPSERSIRSQKQTTCVPEMQGEVKYSKKSTRAIAAGAFDSGHRRFDGERPIPADIYPVIDTDLARDNVENDIPTADLEDLS